MSEKRADLLDDHGRYLDADYCARLDDSGTMGALLKAETAADGATKFVASTTTIDRMGDVIDQSTWRLANFRRNPVILDNHDRGLVVGRGTAKIADSDAGKRLEITVSWDSSESNPTGMLLAHQHANGFRHAGSVGFRPGRTVSRKAIGEDSPFAQFRVTDSKTPEWAAGYLFRHNELLEFSSVAIPANPEAVQLQLHAREGQTADEQIARYLGESLDSRIRALVLEMVQADESVRKSILGAVWSAPLDETKPASDLDRWWNSQE